MKVHVVDIKTQESIDVVDVSGVNLVKSTPFFRALATGGNVSEALVKYYIYRIRLYMYNKHFPLHRRLWEQMPVIIQWLVALGSYCCCAQLAYVQLA